MNFECSEWNGVARSSDEARRRRVIGAERRRATVVAAMAGLLDSAPA